MSSTVYVASPCRNTLKSSTLLLVGSGPVGITIFFLCVSNRGPPPRKMIWLMVLNISGWWFGCHQFYFPMNIGFMSSSQLTDSYFSGRGGRNGPPSSFLFFPESHGEIPSSRAGWWWLVALIIPIDGLVFFSLGWRFKPPASDFPIDHNIGHLSCWYLYIGYSNVQYVPNHQPTRVQNLSFFDILGMTVIPPSTMTGHDRPWTRSFRKMASWRCNRSPGSKGIAMKSNHVILFSLSFSLCIYIIYIYIYVHIYIVIYIYLIIYNYIIYNHTYI